MVVVMMVVVVVVLENNHPIVEFQFIHPWKGNVKSQVIPSIGLPYVE